MKIIEVLVGAVIMVLVIMLFLFFVSLAKDKSGGVIDAISSPTCNGISKAEFVSNLKALSNENAALYYSQVVESSKTPCVSFGPKDLDIEEVRKKAIFCSSTFKDTKISSVNSYRKEVSC